MPPAGEEGMSHIPMKKIIIRDKTKIPPFNEPARDLRVLNKPLWLHQRDVLAKYCTMEVEVDSFDEITIDDKEVLVHRNNLFFDGHADWMHKIKNTARFWCGAEDPNPIN